MTDKIMHVFCIDPYTQKITVEEHDGSLERVYALCDCRSIECARITGEIDAFFDEEGLLKVDMFSRFWKHEDFIYPISGKAIFVGHDEEGDTTAPDISIAELRDKSTYMGLAEVQAYAKEAGI